MTQKKEFNHPALKLNQKKLLIFTALSKHIFYYRMFISKYVLQAGHVPVNPFMSFDYFLLDAVERDLVREGNNNLLMRCDELWVFGPISNGVLVEIQIAKSRGMPIHYFKIIDATHIVKVMPAEIELEEEIKNVVLNNPDLLQTTK